MKKLISLILAFVLLFTSCIEYALASESTYSDEEIVALDTAWLTADRVFAGNEYTCWEAPNSVTYYYNITNHLTLPVAGENGSMITWASSDESVIEMDGTVHRTAYSQGNKTVVLTATLTRGAVQTQKTFTLEVRSYDPTEDEAKVLADYDWLVGESVIHYGCYYNDIRSDVNLPTAGANGSIISWESSDESVIAPNGRVTQPPFSYVMGNVAVTLTATISSGAVSKQKTFDLEVVPQPPEDADDVAADKAWLTNEIVLNGNSAEDVKTRLNLPTHTETRWSPSGYYGGCDITWQSSTPDVISADGRVTRPAKGQGDKSVTFTATISKGEYSDTKTFDFMVTEIEEFPLAIKYDDFSDITRLQFNGVSGTIETTNCDGNSITALQFNNDRGSGEAAGGSIFTRNKIRLGDDLSFSTAFSFRNPHPQFTKGNGGFVFSIQPADNTIYSQYLDDESFKPSLSIAFVADYYSSSGSGQATTYGYSETAAVYYNGDYDNRTVQLLTSGYTNNPPAWNNVWIEYCGMSKTLEVRFSSTAERPVNCNLRIENLDLGQILTSAEEGLTMEDVRDVYAGFMGSVGDAKDKSEIGSWYFKNDSTPIDFEPYNFVDMSHVTLSADPPTGQATSTLTVTVSGEGGPLEGIPVAFSTSLGMLDSSSKTTNAAGQASVILTTTQSGISVVKAVAPGGATALAEVTLTVEDADRVNFDTVWLANERILNGNSSLDNITGNLYLPVAGPNGSVISWESDNEGAAASDGTVTRPAIEQGPQQATLTATLTMGSSTVEKVFIVTVKVRDADLVAADRDWLTDARILGGNRDLDSITGNLNLPLLGANGSSISWSSDKAGVVAPDGTISRPSYTHGDEKVTLTATISMDMELTTKVFGITVKAADPTDYERVNEDYEWLNNTLILNGNESLTNVTSDLYLPVLGPKGSAISWATSDDQWVDLSGKVTRPSYSQGYQPVTLTATVSMGSVSYTRIFIILVAEYVTDAEVVELDSEWLTWVRIMGDNISSGGITGNLNLPVLGNRGASIHWSSSNETVIATDGTVTRPAYTQGNKWVTLTATLSKGSESRQKTFNLIVLKLDQTDQEAVAADMLRLSIYNTLGQNPSPYSVTQNLSLPGSLPNGSSVTWVSGMPGIISDCGMVQRPEYGQGHKSVNLTATISKASVTDNKTFTYTVLSKPDTFRPVVTSASPAQSSTDVLWDTQEITLTYDENIKAGSNFLGVELQSIDATKISVNIDKNKLIITSYANLASGVNKLIVPEGAVTDMSGNPQGYFELVFTVEEKISRKIEVISSNPQDKEKEVPVDSEISLRFNTGEIVAGDAFSGNNWLRTAADQVVSVTPTLNGDTLTLNPKEPLKPGMVYEISIPSGAVRDRFMNENGAQTITFKTAADTAAPVITSVYPLNGQKHVDIHQGLEVSFLAPVKPAQCNLILKDSLGNVIGVYKNSADTSANTVILVPYTPLKPNTEYTLTGPYDSTLDPAQLEFSTRFTTGPNVLSIVKTAPEASNAPINEPVEIEFSSPVTAGPEYDNIEFLDAAGNPVPFSAEERDNKAILTPFTTLVSAGLYIVHIPAGAYQDADSAQSDDCKFSFTTAERLDMVSCQIDSPSEWLVNKAIQLNTDRIEKAFTSAQHQIRYYAWDFGDETAGTGKNPVHTYKEAGEYHVVLSIIDDKGFSYEFEQTVTIVDTAVLEMTVIPPKDNIVYTGSKDRSKLTYSVRLEYNGKFVPGENIKPNLCKNGIIQRTYPVITAGMGENVYVFTFEPDNLLNGVYELVFTYAGQPEKKEIRLPVTIHGNPVLGYPRIRLYDTDARSFYEGDYLTVDVGGTKAYGVKEWDKRINDYCYKITQQFNLYDPYPIKVAGWELKTGFISARDASYEPITVTGKLAKPGITRVTNSLTGSERLDVIEDVSVGPVTFSFEGEWMGLDKGYYEIKTDTDRINRTSHSSHISLYPGRDLRAGEYLMVRMVSNEGVKSPWKYLTVYVIEKPSFLGRDLDISYVDGEYRLSAPSGLKEILGGKISLLDGVPLLDGGNFGIGDSAPSFSGYLDETGREAVLNFSGGGGYGQTTTKTTDTKVKKLKKVVSAGYEVEAQIDGHLWLYYDSSSKKWKLGCAIIDLDGYGGYSWTKGYKIPKINIGVDATLTMGADVWGTLKIDNKGSDTQYSGIIGLRPVVDVSVQLGADWVNVTGFVHGSIPAEIHYPTWYIGADVSLKAQITGEFLTYTETLYKKELYSAHWDNGNKKLVLRALATPAEGSEGSGLELMPRDYLNRESRWLAGGDVSLKGSMALRSAAADESNPQQVNMLENIYPAADVQLVRNGEELWLIWTDDNPERTAANRTQMRYSVLKDGVWSTPAWIGKDETADFAPAVASTGNGTLMAWQNIKQPVTEEGGLGAMIENAEITVTGSAYSAGGSEPQIVTLTDDDKFDHSPALAADGQNALLVWTKSEGLGVAFGTDMEEYHSPANSDRLFFSTWNGSTWSTPAQIDGSLPTVLNSSLTVHDGKGLLLYTLDMDSDLSTLEDREIFARIYDGNLWGEPVRLTDNQVNDLSPKAVFVNGNWFIIWCQDGNLMYKMGLDGETKSDEFLQNVQDDYELTAGQGEKPQIAIVYKQPGENNAQGLSASFYDIDSGLWSGGIPLAQAEGYIKSFSPVFTQEGKLSVAYSSAEIITEVIDGVEQQTISDKVDLHSLTYTPVHDLALSDGDGLSLSTEFPLADTVTTVYATVSNEGDFTENATIELYDGNPANGGVKIAEAVGEQPIPARSSAEMKIEWLVGPEEKGKYELYAIVRSGEGTQDINMLNNAIGRDILTADLAITDLKCENIAGDDYLVTTTVANMGGKTLQGINILMEQAKDPKVLKTESIDRLEPGQKVTLDFFFSSQDLIKDDDGEINMTLGILPPDDVQESNTENNLREFTLESVPILVEAMNPGQREARVDIQTPLTLSFNMNVEEGEGFNQISLMDEELNEISISKTLEGDTLTVAPLSNLQNDTRYTLTIPEEALGDSYGHTLNEPYSLSFTTTAISPEVIFSYPGSQMEDTSIDTGIRLQFNQNIQQGPAFENIVMYGPDAQKLPIAVSIKGEWMYITPATGLGQNMVYSLVVPRGTVKNDKGEAQPEDYELEFTTGKAASNGSEEPSSGTGSLSTVQQGYHISRRVSEDGKTTAIVSVNEQAVIKGTDPSTVIIDLTGELKQDETIQINISAGVLAKLVGYGTGLSIVTGKGDLDFPAAFIASLSQEGTATVTAELASGDKPTVRLTVAADGKQIALSNPGEPFSIAIPYTPTEEEALNPESIIARCTDDSGNLFVIPDCSYNPDTGAVVFNASRFGRFTVDFNKVRFKDVEEDAWYATAVSYIAARGITAGTGGGKFSPKATLTRGDFLVLLMRSYGITPDGNAENNFADAGSTYYTGYLAAAKRLGISAGVGSNSFAPEKEITRQEMFTLLYNALKVIGRLPEGSSGKRLDYFTDAGQIATWAEESMELLVETGIIVGNAGRLTPSSPTTRAEIAQVLYNLLIRR